MKKSLITGIAIATLSSMQLAQAAPAFYSELGVRGVNKDTGDYTNEVYRAFVGTQGKYDLGALSAIYKLEVDFAPAADANDGGDDIYVREAVLIMPTQLGTFIGGRGTTGPYMDIYKAVDLFETNSFESDNPNNFYRQPKRGSKVIAYASPALAGLQLKGALVTPDETNGEDFDIISGRIVYQNQWLKVAAGRSVVADSMLRAAKDYVRHSAGISYAAGRFNVGFAAEENQDHPAGDSTVFGGAIGYKLQNVQLGLGYQVLDNEMAEDDRLIAYQAKYQLNEQVSLWGEIGDYGQSEKDNASLGLSIKF